MTQPLLLDHLLYATPDVDATTADLEERFGVPFNPGGRHPNWGTRNRILPLGDSVYLEVIGPDEEQPEQAGNRILDVDRMQGASMRWWAVRTDRLASTVDALRAASLDPGSIIQGRRHRPDGTLLSWSMTDPRARSLDGILPLLIDWEQTTHPGAEASGVTLRHLRIEHPDPARFTVPFDRFGLPEVVRGEAAAIVATFDTPNGPITLR